MSKKILFFIIYFVFVNMSIAADFEFKRDSEIGVKLGMFGNGDALFKKKLGTGAGKTIQINSLFVWSYDGSVWEKGGNLYLINDDSMGRAYRVVCSVSSEVGDKFMETKSRREISLTGTIKSYDSSSGLLIEPCNATW